MQGKSMTEGAPWKHILKFVLPVLLGSFLQQLYNTVDTIIVGNFSSEEALSAVGTTGSFTFFFMAIAIGLSSGNGVVVAQFFGAKDERNVRKTASAGILFLMAAGVAAAAVGLAASYPAFRYLINVPQELLDLTLLYFRIYAIGIVFQFGYNIFSSILRAVGDSAATLYFLLISSVLNILLDLLFVAVFHMGVAGAAIATNIAQFASFVAAYLYMTKKYPIFRFKRSEYVWDIKSILATIKVGAPISIQLMIVAFGLTFIQRAVNGFGKAMTASFTVAQRVEMYINLPGTALQTTLATYAGQNVGAGKYDRVKKGAWQAMLISLIVTLTISSLIWTFSDNIIEMFKLSDAAKEYCTPHLKAIALVNIIMSMYVPLFGVFQGCGHSIVPTFVATFALGTRVLVVYLFRFSAIFGHTIIWWNGLFGFGMGFMISWTYFLSNRWRKTRTTPQLIEE